MAYNILENDNQHNVVSLINFLEHLEKPINLLNHSVNLVLNIYI